MPSLAPTHKSSKSLENQADAANPNAGLPCVFERHLLLKRIAKGGMGEVFLATAAGAIDGAERPCVVKVIREEHAEDSSFLARFLDEARIQSQLEHPGVVRVVNASHDEHGKPYVVLEHVEGRNLSEVRLRVQQLGIRLAWPDAIAIALGLTEGLAHIHERTDAVGRPLEIVHRDLSPQNVMVAYGGDVKLIDFGTARGQNRKCHTVSGIVFAKPGYVAPEVANNQPGGIPADLYAVGIMLWELLSGRRFIAGDAAAHLAEVAAGTKTITPIAECVDAPPELDIICQKLTATATTDRYESAREAASDLAQLLKRAPSTTDGQRSVRVRISQLMQRLYPAEPTRTRAEFQRLVAAAKSIEPPASALVPAPSPPPPQAQTDDNLELLRGTRYELGSPIGEGASGTVYSATHVDLSRKVALKIFKVSGRVARERLEGFRREARIAAQLSHENVVRIEDFGTSSDGKVYLAMELLAGQSLDKHLAASGALEYRSALLLLLQVCRALRAAHDAGIVHGDLKPQNLFLTRSGSVKLLDFGVSALYGEGCQGGEAMNGGAADSASGKGAASEEKEALSLTGTPEYLAPEQVRGGAATMATDQYALGVLLYEMLTGTHPHQGESMAALLGAKLKEQVVAPSVRAPSARLPRSVDRLCLKLLKLEPKDRYEHFSAVEQVLTEILDESALGRKKPGRAMRMAAVGSILLLGGVAAVLGSEPLRSDVSRLAKRAEMATTAAIARQNVPSLRTVGQGARDAMEKAVARLERAMREEKTALAQAAAPPTALMATVAPSQATAGATEPASKITVSPEGIATRAGGAKSTDFAPIRRALSGDRPGRALALIQAMAEQGNREPELYRLWVEAASRTRAWGDAHRAAVQLSTVEPTPENAVNLAILERRLGRYEAARRTLERALAKSPEHREARALLARMDGSQKVAAR